MHWWGERPAPRARPVVEGLTDLAALLATITLTAAVTPAFTSPRDRGQPPPPPPEPWLPTVMPTAAFRPALVRASLPTPWLVVHWRLGLALLVVVVGLALALGWRVRHEARARSLLEGQLVAAMAEAARVPAIQGALEAAEATIAARDARLGDLGAALATRQAEADDLTARLAAARARAGDLRLALDEQERALADQAVSARAERDRLAADLSAREAALAEREAALADLAARVEGLQARVAETEALTRRVRQTLGLGGVTGPAGGDGPALVAATLTGSDGPLDARIEALVARAEAVTRELAAAERALAERVRGLRQTAAQPRFTAAEAAAAPVGRPVAGPISSGFGPRISPIDESLRLHTGIDIAAPVGTPIRATQAGEVTLAASHGALGLTVILRHAAGFETVYGHGSRLLVTRGQRVEAGQIIALVGNTGASTGPHLHYEVRLRGQALDPAPLLKLAR